MGIKCYDKEIVLETSVKSGLAQKIIEEHDEGIGDGTVFEMFMESLSLPYGMQPFPAQVARIEAEVIREIAQRESCIFVGRHSDYVLRKRTDVINVFIHASLAARIKRVSARSSVDSRQAESIIEKTDRERAKYYNYYSDQKWGMADNYHLSVDTSIVGIEGAVRIILDFIAQKNDNGKIAI
jgi:cytidylate kinase